MPSSHALPLLTPLVVALLRLLEAMERSDVCGGGKHPLVLLSPNDLLESVTRPLDR